jgi:hypothetical protein
MAIFFQVSVDFWQPPWLCAIIMANQFDRLPLGQGFSHLCFASAKDC